MLHPLKSLYGHSLAAKDGAIGHIKDVYFDDKSWAIRYLVADTGGWLDERLVLISPHSFGAWDLGKQTLAVKLTRAQIEASPSIEKHRPVSRQFEADYSAYYGCPAYWAQDTLIGGFGAEPVMIPVPVPSPVGEKHHGHNQRDDSHLHSTRAVKGYELRGPDGSIGRVTDFIADDQSWKLTQLVVETGHWYAGKEILVETSHAGQVSYEEAKIFTELAWTALS